MMTRAGCMRRQAPLPETVQHGEIVVSPVEHRPVDEEEGEATNCEADADSLERAVALQGTHARERAARRDDDALEAEQERLIRAADARHLLLLLPGEGVGVVVEQAIELRLLVAQPEEEARGELEGSEAEQRPG